MCQTTATNISRSGVVKINTTYGVLINSTTAVFNVEVCGFALVVLRFDLSFFCSKYTFLFLKETVHYGTRLAVLKFSQTFSIIHFYIPLKNKVMQMHSCLKKSCFVVKIMIFEIL